MQIRKIIDKNVEHINTHFLLKLYFLKGEIIGCAFFWESKYPFKDKFEGIKRTIINKNKINTILGKLGAKISDAIFQEDAWVNLFNGNNP